MVSKIYTSKNIAKQIIAMQKKNNIPLIESILKSSEIKSLLPKILHALKRYDQKQVSFNENVVYSKTKINDVVLKSLQEKLNLVEPKIIIDNTLSAGVKIRKKGYMIDATLTTMLEQALKKI